MKTLSFMDWTFCLLGCSWCVVRMFGGCIGDDVADVYWMFWECFLGCAGDVLGTCWGCVGDVLLACVLTCVGHVFKMLGMLQLF